MIAATLTALTELIRIGWGFILVLIPNERWPRLKRRSP